MSENGNPKIRFGMWYDFRNPPAWKRPYDQLYNEIIDQIVWGEQNGFDDIWLSEHHFIEDGLFARADADCRRDCLPDQENPYRDERGAPAFSQPGPTG